MSCAVGHRLGLDLALLWLWHGPAAEALIRPLAWEPPYALGVALKKKDLKKKKKERKRKKTKSKWGIGRRLAGKDRVLIGCSS